MGNCNPRALFMIISTTSILCEVCFVPVLIQYPHKSDKNEKYCWSWSLDSPGTSYQNGRCPYLVLLLAALVNGLLLLTTGLFLICKCCGKVDKLYSRIICKGVLKYGTFAANLVTMVLSLLFICLIIAFTYTHEDKVFYFTGGLIKGDEHSHYRFILVCIGALMAFIGATVSGLLSFRYSRAISEDFPEVGMFRSFTDYSTASYEAYDKIN